MTEIVWEEPPPSAVGNASNSKHPEIAAALRSNPGRWAKIATANGTAVTHIKRGQWAAYRPAGSFEAVGRNSRMVDGRRVFDIYARYIGDIQYGPAYDDDGEPL